MRSSNATVHASVIESMKRATILAAALLLLPLPAAAQAPPFGLGGISVTATANKKVPATSARITLGFSTADRALTLNKQTLQPIVDAFVISGADPASIPWPINFNAPGARMLVRSPQR
jgi:hypothetical protein